MKADGFNSGDLKAAYASFATGEITIVDEFAPYRWTGLHAAQAWAAAYDKHALATGVTEGKVMYESPSRQEVEGDLAYVIIPTAYLYKEHGKAIKEEGHVTAMLHREGGAWKKRGWTWSGVNRILRRSAPPTVPVSREAGQSARASRSLVCHPRSM